MFTRCGKWLESSHATEQHEISCQLCRRKDTGPGLTQDGLIRVVGVFLAVLALYLAIKIYFAG